MKYLLNLIVLLIFSNLLMGQGSGIPLRTDTYHILDRLEIKTGEKPIFHSTLKYYNRGDVVKYALHLDTSRMTLTGLDRSDLYYLFKDNNEWLVQGLYPTTIGGPREMVDKEFYVDSTNIYYTERTTPSVASYLDDRYILSRKPLLKHFYKTPANLFEVNEEHFHLRVNPIIHFKYGESKDQDDPIFFNKRGVEIRAGFDDRIYFYTNIHENQASFANYVNQYIDSRKAIPGEGFYKRFGYSLFNIKNARDYLNAQGHLGFNFSKHVGMQFGYGRHFIGDGYRSLLLSDFANNFLFLKFNTRVWKLHYQNIFAEITAEGNFDQPGNALLTKKYAAIHHLSFDVSPTFNIGVFEGVVFQRENGFELNYLNPIIFYRAIEQAVGSPDNAMIGANFKWNFLKRFQLYGQVLLDEFKFDELTSGEGWWANKYGIQLGSKYIDVFGIDHLDAQVEYNTARPYTYAHRLAEGSYSHYNQALAHPLGANFKETILKIRYQPKKKWVVEGKFFSIQTGEDSDTTNWGGDILADQITREMEYGNVTGQGIAADILIAGLDIHYQFFHNMYLDLYYFHRRKDSEEDVRDLTTNYFGAGLRLNIADRRQEF